MKQTVNARDYLGRIVTIEMDRPLGTKHPDHGFIYERNYGFVPGTISGDGEELDAYILNVDTAIDRFTGLCVAVIHRTDDNDDKLIIIPDDDTITDEQIEEQISFRETKYHHVLWRAE